MSNDIIAAIEALKAENARIRGETLATGVILAQLLQSMAKQQLSPHAFATKIMKQAEEAVQGFNPGGDAVHNAVVKSAAVETVKHYEEQIRSVLPI